MINIKGKVKSFLLRYFRNQDFSDDDDFFALGFVNSLFAMELVLYVEKEFGISVSNEDLNFDNFRSVNAISELIGLKLACL